MPVTLFIALPIVGLKDFRGNNHMQYHHCGIGMSWREQSISCPKRNGLTPVEVCHKCAVRFDPMCAKALLFNTRADCFRAGLIVGKLLNCNGDKTWKTLSDSPTLNQ